MYKQYVFLMTVDRYVRIVTHNKASDYTDHIIIWNVFWKMAVQ